MSLTAPLKEGIDCFTHFPASLAGIDMGNTVRPTGGLNMDFYTRDYLSNSSSSSIAWIGSINAFILISGGLISGPLFDRGYFRTLVYGGCLIQSFSLFMLSLCKRQQYYQIFLAQGLGLGIGFGMVYLPSIAVLSHYFRRRRALAMTIAASGSSLGATVHPIMLNNTFDKLGFGNAVRASAGMISALLLVVCLIMHPRLPPAAGRRSVLRAVPRFARDGVYVFAVLGMAFYNIGFYFVLFYLQLDSITHGISQTLSFYSLVIMNGASFFGRLSPGFFAHKLGVVNIICASAGVGTVLIFCVIALKTVASVVTIGVLYGYSVGIFVTMMAPLLTVLTDDMGELGLRMGLGFSVVGIAGLIGPPINGALLTSRYIWWKPALFSGIMALVGFGFLLATVFAFRRKMRVRREGEIGKSETRNEEKGAA
ncbi:MFS general substrate transporter [Favolaschia claudopus]|uniref:MFS general substrate transporter n=1 Tax=Favolaschia claudopus TaxID=2862362 RepID=A0AAW0DHM6_9AGAR